MWDGRAMILPEDDKPILDPIQMKNVNQIKQDILNTYGGIDFDKKLKRFKESGYLNMSMMNEHNRLILNIRDSYISGYYYPALVGSCALGERILNDLILKLRPFFPISEDKQIHKKDAFTNWEQMTNALISWNIIGETEEEKFLKLKDLRSFSIHYDPKLHSNLAERAKEALSLVSEVNHLIFSAMLSEKYRIAGTKGVTFVRKDQENHPFVKTYILPHCIYVGPKHKFVNLLDYPPQFTDDEYPDVQISDEEYATYFK